MCWLIVLSVIFVPALMTPTKSLARLAHPAPMTWRRHCVVFPFDGTIILASGVSMRRTESVNSTPWQKRRATCMKREMVGVAVKTGGPLTPADSIMSLGNLHSVYSIYSTRSYLPEKLQIVKPLEGDRAKSRPFNLLLFDALWALMHHSPEDLSTQHSFYFRHTQPRCWFEI